MTMLLLVLAFVSADSLGLAQCYVAAQAHFPLAPQERIHKQMADFAVSNIEARYLPSLSLNGAATYHSDVPVLPIEVPGISPPEVRSDQYKVALQVEQIIFDGGRGTAQARVEHAAAEVAGAQVDIAFHQVREGINDAYFGALLQESAAASLASMRSDVEARRAALVAQSAEGLIATGEVDKLDVELLRIDQQIAETMRRRSASLAVLEELTGLTIPEQTALIHPDIDVDSALSARRPEFLAFDLRREQFEQQRRLTGRRHVPTVSSFATAAYGRPAGMNIFNNNMSPFYTVGIQMNWPFWDWGTERREQQILDLRGELVDTEEEAFAQRIRAEAAREWEEIERLRTISTSDREILQLRARIADRAAKQLDGGTISATDYILERHAEEHARLAAQRHQIELTYAKVRYLTILGRIDETV